MCSRPSDRSGEMGSWSGQGERESLLKDDAEALGDRSSKYGAIAEETDLCEDTRRDKKHATGNRTPLPMKQLSVLLAMRAVEPLAYSQIFPYVNRMIVYLGAAAKPSQAGYYSGLLESAFAVAELCTVLSWGRLAERIGRKRVLIVGLVGSALTSFLFGISKSYPWALLIRGLAGSLSGNHPILLNIVGDITDVTNEVVAIGLFAGINNVAEVTGPFIGGTFAEPEITFPNTFGSIPLLRHFPFLLPCLVCAILTSAAIVLGLIRLREVPRRVDGVKHNDADRRSFLRVASFPPFRAVLINYFLLTVMENALYVVFCVYAYAPIENGGLSRNPTEIGYALVYCGTLGAICQIFVLPWLRKYFGALQLFKYLMKLFPVMYACFPLVNWIARRTVVTTGNLDNQGYTNPPAGIAVWAGVAFILLLDRLACISFSLCTLMVRDASPSPAAVATGFGLAHLVNCGARAVAPAFASALFSLSSDIGLFNGNLVWVVMVILSFFAIWATSILRNDTLHV